MGHYKTLMNRAREGRSLIGLADRFIALAPSLPTDSDREEALGYIQESAEALAQLVGGGSKGNVAVATPGQSTSIFRSPFLTLFAAAGECGCDALRQQDTAAYRYFCGEGTAKSLSEARRAATENAVSRASSALQRTQSHLPAGELTSYLRSVSAEVAACPVSGPKGFTMFVLLRVPTTLTTANAQQAFVRPTDGRSRVRLKLEQDSRARGRLDIDDWLDVRSQSRWTIVQPPEQNYTVRPPRNE